MLQQSFDHTQGRAMQDDAVRETNSFQQAARGASAPGGDKPGAQVGAGGPPYCALDAVSEEGRAFIQDLLDRGEATPVMREGRVHVSYWALEPYLPAGSDPSDWDADWDGAGG